MKFRDCKLALGLAILCFLGQTKAAEVGTPCPNGDECDDTVTFLECEATNKICQCQKSGYFDKVDGMCHIKVEAECVKGNIPCPINGDCDTFSTPPHKCQCLQGEGFVPTPGKKCAKIFGDGCTAPHECDLDSYFVCDTNCACNGNSVHDPTNKKCVLKASQECTVPTPEAPSQQCRQWAACLPVTGGTGSTCQCNVGLEETTAGECKSGLGGKCDTVDPPCNEESFLECEDIAKACVCAGELVENVNNKCRAVYDKPCNLEDLLCDESSFLECGSESKCICKDNMIFKDGGCKAVLHGSCAANEPCDETEFLECKDNSGVKTCECKGDLVANGAGKCRAAFDKPCNIVDLLCDDVSFLECGNDNKCKCKGDMTFKDGGCKGILHGSCANGEPCDGTEFLECKDNSGVKTCECKSGLVENGNKKCRANWDEPCATDDLPCNEDKFLDCQSGKCACFPDMIDIDKGECRAIIGGSCDGSKLCNTDAHLICSGAKICECDAGLEENTAKECKTGLSGSCATIDCNNDNFLECGAEDICGCRADLEDNGKGKCTTTLGKPCGGLNPLCNDAKYLECQSNICACKTGLEDNGKGECRALWDQPCNSVDLPCNEARFLECGADNKCRCRADLSDIGAGQCRASIDHSCAGGVPCNEMKYLECNADKCQCQSGLINNGRGQCRATIDSPCFADLPCDESNFLVCEADQLCHCKTGMTSQNGICKAGYAESCANEEPCDESQFLECGPNKICVCDADHQDDGNGHCDEGGDIGRPCDTAGTFPDPANCNQYHVCEINEAGDLWELTHTCPNGNNFCKDTLTCDTPLACPCL